jgi:bla regulator protein BlaR1
VIVLDVIDAIFWLALAYLMTIAIILLARPIVARIAGTNWVYALWGVLLVPPLAAFAPSIITDSIRLWSYPTLNLPAADAAQIVLLGLWTIGVVVTGSVSIRRSIQIHRDFEDSFGPLSVGQMAQIQESCSRASVFPPPRTVLSFCCASPAVMSGLTPTLVLPDDFFQKYSPSERNLILHHELVHLRRFDLVWNVMFRSLRCLLWFVPFIKYCEKAFRTDQERSCDHSVVCDEPGSRRVDYARALYKTVIPTPNSTGVTGFRNSRHELLQRTELLGVHRRTHARSMAGIIALAICALLTVSVSANSSAFTNSVVPSSSWCSVYDRLGL